MEIHLYLAESLVRSDHKQTPEQLARFKKHGFTLARKFELTPSGRLVLYVGSHYGGQKWSDTAHRTLEDRLGKAILGVEDAAEQRVAANLEAQQRGIRECEEAALA